MGRPRKEVSKEKAKKAIKKLKTAIIKKIKEVKNLDKPVKIKKTKNSASDLMREFLKVSGNEWGAIASDGIEAGDISGFMDTGAYALNALVSGKLQGGGFPSNKITVLAGEEATGKTFFVIECIKQWFTDNPTGLVMFFESESAISKEMLESRGVDTNRIVWLPVVTVQEVRTQALKILNKYLLIPVDKRIPMMFILDSLGMLSTTKEVADTEEGKETQDMTRSRLIKSMFRVLTLKLGRAGIPFIVTNHTYMEQGMFAKKQMCLAKDTNIRLLNGEIKYIQDIVPGDIVKTVSGSEIVDNVFKFKSSDVYEVELEDGRKMICNGEHKVLNNNLEWVEVGELFSIYPEWFGENIIMVNED